MGGLSICFRKYQARLYLCVDQNILFAIYCSQYPPDYLMIMSKTIFKNATKLDTGFDDDETYQR